MGIKVLMLGGDEAYMLPDAQLLRDRGFWVYTCKTDNVDDTIREIQPELVFVNPNDPGLGSTKVYHHLLDSIEFASVPLIYTLAEDEVYLINRKRTSIRERRNFTTDNIIDGIRVALSDKNEVTKLTGNKKRYDNIHIPLYANRA